MIRRGFIELSGTRVHVHLWGEGPPLVCVHGLGGGGHFFAPLGALLAERCRVAALDLPGSGLSPLIPAFSFERCAELVVDLAREEHWESVSLLGHSLGTIVALEAARRAPNLVRSLVCVGGLPEAMPASRVRLTARIEQVRRKGLVGLGEQVVDANFSCRTRTERPELTSLFARLFEMQSPAGYLATAEALVGWDAPPLPLLEGIRCLAITGREDLYAPPEAVQEFARALPPGTEVRLMEDCGHLPFLEEPEAFGRIVGAFLAGG